MKSIDKLKFWCYKILPLVYDDSLSYYEVLCKVQSKLNEIIDNVNGIPDEIIKAIGDGTIVAEAVKNYLEMDSDVILEAITDYLEKSNVIEDSVNNVLENSTLVNDKIEEILSDDETLKNEFKNNVENVGFDMYMGGTIPNAITDARNQAIYLHRVELYNAISPEDGVTSSLCFWFYSKSSATIVKNSGRNSSATVNDIKTFLNWIVNRYGENCNFLMQYDAANSGVKFYSYSGYIDAADVSVHGIKFLLDERQSEQWIALEETTPLSVSANTSKSNKTYFEETVTDTGDGNFS